MPAIFIRACRSPLNMNVRRAGDPAELSSLLFAYSNSKATMTRLGPIARPLAAGFVGVGLTPRKAVMSAAAVDGIPSRPTARRTDTIQRCGVNIPKDNARDTFAS